MSGKHQGLRYFQKFLNSKASERNALAKKVLRYVMAVGFVLSPWLGGEAYAAGIVPVNGSELSYNDKGTVNIYAQDVKGDVGWNSFTHFNVDAGKIANLHFCKDANGDALNTLVNTVTNQININGTVNAIKKDGTVGGNLYFLSPGGMVVGSTGVINAGSLTVMAPTQEFINNLNFDNLYLLNNIVPLNDSGKITISGQIHASGGVDLRAAYLSISRPVSDNSSSADPINTNSSATVTAANLFTEVVNLTGNDVGEATALKAVIDAGGKVYLQADKEMTIQNTQINAGGNFDIVARALGTSDTGQLRLENSSIYAVGDLCVDVGGRVDIYNNFALTSDKPSINMYTQTGDIYNYGNFAVNKDLNITAGSSPETESADFTNAGTIQSTGGGVTLTSRNSFTNKGTVQANAQIKFTVGGNLTNEGKIESTSSNVQAHIGRNFKNLGDADSKSLQKGFIQAGGNVQVDYNLDTEHTYIGVATPETGEKPTIEGIYNSGLIWAKGDKDPVKKPDGTVDANSGSGNIWLTSAYNIENTATGQMIAGRQITLNARDFLHNYGLIQGVTYLDIKSIMGYVYNHASGVIRATGGNIDLSTGQANLVIENDEDGTKKELYRKFTPIIIEGSVEAFSDKNNTTNQTNEGDIKITAHLGDIYVNGGTIRANAKQVTSGEKESAAGDVILDAAQNITIGFETVKAWADDPTTQAGLNGENKDKYERNDEREYFINTSTLSQKAAEISGSNITLISGSGKTISMSTVNNTLTASDTITINTDSMNIVGGTFNAGTLNATGALELTGGTVTSNGDLTISGAKGLTIGNGAGISTGGNLTFASSEGAVINDHTWDNQNGSVTLSGKTGVTNNAVIEANGSVYITSKGGRVTNKASITAGKNFATAAAASPFSLRARALARAVDTGSVKISGRDGVINNNAEASISAAGGVSITSEAGAVQNSSAVNTSGSVEISGSSVSNSGALTTTSGSVEISGSSGIKNTGNITATDNVSMTASAGSIINTGTTEIKSTGGSVEISGSSGIENTANIEASKNVTMTASAGSIINAGTTEIKSTGGSVEISGSSGIENTGNITATDNVTMTASAGSIKNSPDSTVASTSGSVSMNAGGDVTGGTITGKDVTLTGGSGYNVAASSIVVDKSLQLQGDNITATNVKRGNDASGALNVGVSGAGGSNSTAQGDVNIKITSDVVFSNVNVSNANVETSGTIEVEKLHVEGKAGFVSSDTTVNIYGQGVTPDPNDTTAIQDKGDGNSSWLTLKIDDTGVQSTFVGEEAKAPNIIQDSAVQMSGKLVDYNPYDTYLEQYGDVADIFCRTDLVVADLIVANASSNGGTTQNGVVVLKQDDDGLRIEEEKKE